MLWLYYNSKGQLLESINTSGNARAGTTDFQIFAYFEGVNLSIYNTATLKLRKPDYQEVAYPSLGMESYNATFQGTSSYFVSGRSYSGYRFNFADFNDTEDIAILLDTPGLWKAVITLYGNAGTINVQGICSFFVENGVYSPDGTELDFEDVLPTIYAILSNKLNISDGIVVLDTYVSGTTDLSGYRDGQLIYVKNTKKFLKVSVNSNTDARSVSDFDFGFLNNGILTGTERMYAISQQYENRIFSGWYSSYGLVFIQPTPAGSGYNVRGWVIGNDTIKFYIATYGSGAIQTLSNFLTSTNLVYTIATQEYVNTRLQIVDLSSITKLPTTLTTTQANVLYTYPHALIKWNKRLYRNIGLAANSDNYTLYKSVEFDWVQQGNSSYNFEEKYLYLHNSNRQLALSTAVKFNTYDATTIDQKISSAVTTALKYQGSYTVAELNTIGATLGQNDTGNFYNVTNSGTLTIGSLQVMAGDNIVWTGSGWDKMTMDLSVYDDKFIAAGFFSVEDYNEENGTITFVYASDLYNMTYNENTGILTIEAN